LALDRDIYRQRTEKLRQLQALGCELYPHRFDFTHSLPQLLREYQDTPAEALEKERIPVRVSGRLVTLRLHGKAGFAHLLQGGARFQIYVRQDGVDARSYSVWKLLDLGDFVGVTGYLFRTRTGELTVHVESLAFLAKDLRPLPEKWHGLQDVEARYRRRYLDLIMNPEVRGVFTARSRIIQSLRAAFEERGYIEVETPMMQTLAGGAVARPFVTHHKALDLQLYLRIAPELFLKRLIVGGLERVYEINRNFRNEGISTQHNPEFTMLEFYEAYSDYNVLMEWSEKLLKRVAEESAGASVVPWARVGRTGMNVPEASLAVERQAPDAAVVAGPPVQIDFGQFRRLSLREAIREFWPEAAGERPSLDEINDPGAVAGLVERYNRAAVPEGRYTPLRIERGEPAGVTLAALFEAVAEDELVQPTIVFDFPLAVSPLAKSKPDEPDWVERFEIYAAGMELANGYSELNDPAEQRRRFEMQLEQRERGSEEAHAMDEDYIRALEFGMPPTAGEGIGIDRLAMVLTNSRSIRDVILFPLLRPESGDSETTGEDA
jgi:lysyl-tRNA synthetase class 2